MRLLVLLVLLSPAWCLERVQGWCSVGAKVVVTSSFSSTTKVQASYPSCTVTVTVVQSSADAVIYSNNTGSSLSNPFTAASDGSWYFYAQTGRYNVTISGGGLASPYTFGDIYVNPTFLTAQEYGAVCDGSTDDGPAFNLAFAAAYAQNVIGVTAPGNATGCNIATQMVLSQTGVGLYCGAGTMFINNVSSSSNHNAALAITGTGNVIQGCTFNANSVAIGTGTGAVEINGATNTILNQVTLTNVANYGIRADGSTGISINQANSPFIQLFSSTSISVSQSTLWGLNIETPGGGGAPGVISVTGNTLHSDPTVYNIDAGNGTCLTIGDFSSGHNYPPSNFSVTGNSCSITGTTSGTGNGVFGCFSIAGVRGGTVSGNSCNAASQYIGYAGLELGCDGCAVTGNAFYMPDSGSQAYYGITSYGPHTTITSNSIYGFGNDNGYGIRVYVQSPAGAAIHADDLAISNNTVVNSTAASGSGIQVVCTYSSGGSSLNDVIAGNTIDTTAANGIELQDFHTTGCPISALITGNNISNSSVGLYLNTVTATIGPNPLNNVATPITTTGTNVIAPLAFTSPISAPNVTDTALISTQSLATDSNGKIVAGAQYIQGQASFTPSTTGWYRIYSTTISPGAISGTVDIAAIYHNKVSNLTIDFRLGSNNQPSMVNIRNLGAYGGFIGVIDEVEASGNGTNAVYLDIHIGDATTPAPVSLVFTGPGIVAAGVVSSPVAGASPGADSVALVNLTLTNANAAAGLPGFVTTNAGIFQGNVFTPSSSTLPCIPGATAMDASYAYFCIASATWLRVAITTF